MAMRTHLHTAILTIVLCSAQVREDEDTRPISPAEAMTMDTLTTTDINSSYVKHTTEHEAAVVTSVGDDVVNTTHTTKTTTSRLWRKLWVTYTTPNSDAGYVTTPFYGESAPYPNHINDSFILDLPPNHVVMISFSDFDIADHNNCRNDSVTLYEIVQSNTSQVWKKCGPYTLGLPAQVFRNSLRLDVQSNLTPFNAGFKMLFTVLPESQEPESLGNGTYNCSVPHFERFRPHFNCNLVKECQDMEDERDCSYTSDECGVGFVDLGDKCFTFPKVMKNVTWYDAYTECRVSGYNLITFRTPSEWNEVWKLFGLGRIYQPMYVGLQTSQTSKAALPAMYRQHWQWVDDTMAYYIKFPQEKRYFIPQCAVIKHNTILPDTCFSQTNATSYCERKKNRNREDENKVTLPSLNSTDAASFNTTSAVTCPNGGHLTLDFLSCDPSNQCGFNEFADSCETPSAGSIPQFRCGRGFVTLHYTLVCDHQSDCPDQSDEVFCKFQDCPKHQCNNGQCISADQRCDGVEDCLDGSDEESCHTEFMTAWPSPPPPAVVQLGNSGKMSLRTINSTDACPVTHFRCPDGYCMPVYLRCNGVYDCPGMEDEKDCDSYTCPGFYRCRHSTICVHVEHVCDGVRQCPRQDDELLCDLQCPFGCRCQGLAFVCGQPFQASSFPQIRYLDASNSAMRLEDLSENYYLVELVLRNCKLDAVRNMTFRNLKFLDLSANLLTSVNMISFFGLENLKELSLSENPLRIIDSPASHLFFKLESIDLSWTSIEIYDSAMLGPFRQLETLNLSHSALHTVTERGFNSTPELEHLYLDGAPLKTYPYNMLNSLKFLELVHTDDFKLCCPDMLPDRFPLETVCITVANGIASCRDLLREDLYRGFLWIFALLALVGNVGSFVTRLYLRHQSSGQSSFNVFVTNLCVADFLMGVYLTIIGVADEVYRGKYVRYDTEWKHSLACKVAGFLSLLSSEVSAFNICLITVDRFLVLRFPFSRVRFGRYSATAACVIAWIIGLCLASVPLLPVTSDWEFYSQTGICIPLPINRASFKGGLYSFNVMIVLNFVLFLLIAVGQAVIFYAIRSNSMTTAKKSSSRDAAIARRLTTIVLSDFLCWFPICVLGLMAANGTTVSTDVNVGMAIFVLPFNSALNPFLYTFNILMEKRRRAEEAKLMKRLEMKMATVTAELDVKSNAPHKLTKASAIGQIKTWLEDKTFTLADLTSQLELWDASNQDESN